MRYQDEPWGNRNLLETFGPFVHEKYKNREMYNVGVLAGTRQAIQELSQTIYEMSHGRKIQIVDQAVFNFIINQHIFSAHVLKLPSEAGWAAQLGTTGETKMAELGNEHKVFTSDGSTEFSILHQYERIPDGGRCWRNNMTTDNPLPLERNIVVLLPDLRHLLVLQHAQRPRQPPAGGMGPDHIVNITA